MRFTRITFGCLVQEGYGQTEFVAPVTMTSLAEVAGGMLALCNGELLISKNSFGVQWTREHVTWLTNNPLL